MNYYQLVVSFASNVCNFTELYDKFAFIKYQQVAQIINAYESLKEQQLSYILHMSFIIRCVSYLIVNQKKSSIYLSVPALTVLYLSRARNRFLAIVLTIF